MSIPPTVAHERFSLYGVSFRIKHPPLLNPPVDPVQTALWLNDRRAYNLDDNSAREAATGKATRAFGERFRTSLRLGGI
jgi:hypothetical protein